MIGLLPHDWAGRLEIYLGLSERTRGAIALNVFDNATGTRAVIAQNPAFVDAADNVVWWSTGGGDATTWHALDLTTLQ